MKDSCSKLILLLAFIGWGLAGLFYWRMEWVPLELKESRRANEILIESMNQRDIDLEEEKRMTEYYKIEVGRVSKYYDEELATYAHRLYECKYGGEND